MLTKEQIQFLNQVCPYRWKEENGVVNVNGHVNISNMNLTKIPVQFGQVNGHFYCDNNELTNLIGSPSIIHGQFNCQKNKLTSLEGGPKEVSLKYSCAYNQLTTLIGAIEICNSIFYCRGNQLTSLEGCPRIIKRHFDCSSNLDLEYLWCIGRVEDEVYYDNYNEINEWIITCACEDIIFPYFTLEENINWIKHEQKYSSLLDAPNKICQHFSSYIKNILLDVC